MQRGLAAGDCWLDKIMRLFETPKQRRIREVREMRERSRHRAWIAEAYERRKREDAYVSLNQTSLNPSE